MPKRLLVRVLALVFVMIFLTGCSTQKQPVTETKTEKVTAVEVGRPVLGTLSQSTTFSGQLKPIHTVTVIPKIAGMAEVKELKVQLGDHVNKGELLFILDREAIEDQIESARLAYETAKRNHEKTKENIDNAKLNLERTETLFREGVISKQQYEQAQLSASDSQLKPLEAQLEQSKASYDLAKKQLDDMVVKAPIRGVISSLNIQEKGMASAQPALAITDVSVLEVEINVTEGIINQLKQGQKVSLRIPSVSNEPIPGKIGIINPVPDPANQLYKVKIEVENEDGQIKPGMFAQVSINMEEKEQIVMIPVEALMSEEDQYYVYVVEAEKAVRKIVTVGLDNGEMVEIVSGLQVDDPLIIKGQDFVKDGEKVKVVRGDI